MPTIRKNLQGWARGLLVALPFAAGQDAFAHTLLKEPAKEGYSSWNALNITHGCHTEKFDANGKEIINPVIAESVVIPTVNPVVLRPDPKDPEKTRPIDLSAVIEGGGLSGLFSLIQDAAIFKKQSAKKDALGNLIGIISTDGRLQPGSVDGQVLGLVQFHLASPFFIRESCANSLVIHIAVADICKITKQPAFGEVNLWIPNVTDKFPDPSIDGSSATPLGGAPASLVVERDRKSNPLPKRCKGGYTVTVWPSNEDVDANLPIPGVWPAP